MSTQYSSAWGHTLRQAAWRRQVGQKEAHEPIPGFFQGKSPGHAGGLLAKEEPASFSPEEAMNQGVSRIESPSVLKSQKTRTLSPEFIQAISQRGAEASHPSIPHLSLSSHRHQERHQEDGQAYDDAVASSQFFSRGYVLAMNKISLIALVFGLITLGLLFFAGGFMLAVNFVSEEAPPPAQHLIQHPQNASGSLHVPPGGVMPPQTALPPATAVPAVPVAPSPAAAAPVPAAPAAVPAPTAPVSPQSALHQEGAEAVISSVANGTASANASPVNEVRWNVGEATMVDVGVITRPYALQIGVYQDRGAASRIVDLLHMRGYHAYMVLITQSSHSPIYAVRMGGYFTQQAAHNAARHLTQKEKFKVIAIAKNNGDRVVYTQSS